jgi:formate dehydrogenase subunit beta
LGTVCRACEERGLVELAKRGQVDWDRLHLIGVECTSEEAQICRCSHPRPTHAPTVVDAPPSAPEGGPSEDSAGVLPEAVEDRLEFWRYWSERCIKCYGCVYACPQCFCPACALESPLWVERGRVPPPFPAFHLIKAIHMAGRCTSCRECELVCPAEIPLTLLYRMVGRDVEDLFGYGTGASLEAVPPLLLALEEGARA